ncbi:hypothetical protein FRX31_026408 [Thalictrum thalictroides]|uniref:Uncharacterized protein n=1 Tax=Thalictrum thalictroides TaxID=46969 RepID=A0A7J6VFV8_THATH|nr:hypothetical protein FRX31_026408 [Thalictrum thalictroides]
MGELTTLAKARQELEDLYLGIPDESVNLTFQDFAELKVAEKKKPVAKIEVPIDEAGGIKKVGSFNNNNMEKSPSLDFSKAIHASRPRQQHHVVEDDQRRNQSLPRGRHLHVHVSDDTHHHHHNDHLGTPNSARRNAHIAGFRSNIDSSSIAFDDMSGMSGVSRTYPESGRRRRRAGIPHSNICTICSTYIYIFRNRCLVCGRVYCRHCVGAGMGEMTEGRKCVECLGRKFSHRYIHTAGNLGCFGVGCCGRYSTHVKIQELKWQEKGPRRSRDQTEGYDRSGMVSARSRSPVTPRTPTRAQVSSSSPNSFVMSSQFSPYSATHPHIPY